MDWPEGDSRGPSPREEAWMQLQQQQNMVDASGDPLRNITPPPPPFDDATPLMAPHELALWLRRGADPRLANVNTVRIGSSGFPISRETWNVEQDDDDADSVAASQWPSLDYGIGMGNRGAGGGGGGGWDRPGPVPRHYKLFQEEFKPKPKTGYELWMDQQQRLGDKAIVVECPVVRSATPPARLQEWDAVVAERDKHAGEEDLVSLWREWRAPVPTRSELPYSEEVDETADGDCDWDGALPCDAITEEIQNLHARRRVTCLPPVVRQRLAETETMKRSGLQDKEEEAGRECPNVEVAFTDDDPLGRVEVSVPDGSYEEELAAWMGEMGEGEERQRAAGMARMWRASKADYALVLGAGGCALSFLGKEDGCELLIAAAIPANREQETIDAVWQSMPEAVEVRVLSDAEKRHASRSGAGDTVYTVSARFANCEAARKAKKVYAEELRNCVLAPRWMIPGRTHQVAKEVSIYLRWFRAPPGATVTVKIKSACLLQHTMNVFRANHMDVQTECVLEQKELRVSRFPRHLDRWQMEQHVRNVLDRNSIDYTSIRSYSRPPMQQSDADIRRNLHEKLIRVADSVGLWRRPIPFHPQEWSELLSDESQLPWTIQRLESTGDGRYKSEEMRAQVRFSSYTRGLAMARHLCSMPTDPRHFSLNPDDKRGVVINAVVSYSTGVSHRMRLALHDQLMNCLAIHKGEGADEEEWCAISDFPHLRALLCEQHAIGIDGWPETTVSRAWSELEAGMCGVPFACPEGGDEGVLMQGYGRSFALSVEASLSGRVLLDWDEMARQLRLIGSPDYVDAVQAALADYVVNSRHYSVTRRVSLEWPRCVPTVKDMLLWIGEERVMRRVEGERKAHFARPSMVLDGEVLTVTASPQQHDTLDEYIDQLDRRLYSSLLFPVSSPQTRPDCAICCCAVSNAHYVLATCGHQFCKQCIVQQVSSSISSNSLPINCVECDKPVAIDDIMLLVLGASSRRVRRHDARRIAPLLRAAITQLLLTGHSGLSACPTPDCEAVFRRCPASSVQDPLSPPEWKCGICRRTVCRVCSSNTHRGETCERHAELVANADESINAFMSTRGSKAVKRCPTEACRMVIEKSAGCNHMHCVSCKTHFCWLCDGVFESEAATYRHLSEAHGGSGGGWRIENGMVLEAPADEDELDEGVMQELLLAQMAGWRIRGRGFAWREGGGDGGGEGDAPPGLQPVPDRPPGF